MTDCDDFKDDDRPTNTLEYFAEIEEISQMITSLKPIDAAAFEKDYEHFTEILSRYQEQPHLLDSHIEDILEKLFTIIRRPASSDGCIHAAFKYLYIICKVRNYKVLVKYLPHELSDLDFALCLLEKQNPLECQNWETRYMLLLWLSILVLNPFPMSRLDAYDEDNELKTAQKLGGAKSKLERIYEICEKYTSVNDTCSSIAAYLCAKYLIRSDVKDIYMKKFFDWVISNNHESVNIVKYGQLEAIATILKHGKREDLLEYITPLWHWITTAQYKDTSDYLKQKYYIKIVQRFGLIYLKPQLAHWRYKRGTRSLELNLAHKSNTCHEVMDATAEVDTEISVPDVIEEVIEELLQGLKSSSNEVRWSAAKGIGRVTSRLPKSLADEVIGSVIDILNPLEPHEAWHGACLALAELAKRGLLLPYRLKELVPMLLQALFYDELKGYMSVGQHIRDASCYMCWAFARAYNPEDLQPFVQQISAGLLTVACFDREINCRRAASAAFQESVGRLGNFPHGIEISTNMDFYSVGLRQNSYLNISDFIASYKEYNIPLIEHLVKCKVPHWDSAIRELTSKTLYKLTLHAPSYMCTDIWQKLIAYTDSIDINTRHGSVLAISQITLALSKIEKENNCQYLSNQMVSDLNELLGKFVKRDLFRGMSGEIMKQCCIEFIRNCSLAKVDIKSENIDIWQQILDKCILNKSESIREPSTTAFAELCMSYYNMKERESSNKRIILSLLKGAESDLEEHIRMGYISAIGVLPKFMITPFFDIILDCLIQNSLPPLCMTSKHEELDQREVTISSKWSEARRDSVKALSTMINTVGFEKDCDASFGNAHYFDKALECLLCAMEEYTLDNRGDIGAWVRESAMNAIYHLLTNCPRDLLKPHQVHQVLLNLMQQSVEKIDRTRGLAGRIFCQIIHHEPAIPYIQQHESLKSVFPKDISSVLWLFADQTFPLFCSVLRFEEYSKTILLGLSASIGQLTESLIKYSSNALFEYLRSHPEDIERICKEITENFEENLMNERITYPMLNFLDALIGSGTINKVLLDDQSTFAEDIFRLLSIEIKGHKKLYKLISSINVYCQLLQVPRLSKRVLMKMSIFLGLTHVHVRKTSATKLYEALALYGDTCDVTESNMDEVLNILSETDWSLPLIEVRPIRNRLCSLLNIKPPVNTLATSHK